MKNMAYKLKDRFYARPESKYVYASGLKFFSPKLAWTVCQRFPTEHYNFPYESNPIISRFASGFYRSKPRVVGKYRSIREHRVSHDETFYTLDGKSMVNVICNAMNGSQIE